MEGTNLTLELNRTKEDLKKIFNDPAQARTFVEQKGLVAQAWLDRLQLLAACPSTLPRLRSSVLTIMLQLSKKSGLYPHCLTIQNVKKISKHPVAYGGSGGVWKGMIGDSKVLVCLKTIKICLAPNVEKLCKAYFQEAIVWRQLNHPNVLPLLGIYYLGDDPRLCLISPWMENGSLVQYVKSTPREEIDHYSLVYDVANGLSYLHLKDVVHGDLKGANVLITRSRRACIGDFGLSRVTETHGSHFTTSTTRLAGTSRWLAPELLNGVVSTTKESDIYAYGCVCFEIFTGLHPFPELPRDGTVVLQISQGKHSSRPNDISELDDSMWAIMVLCWNIDPFSRPSLDGVLAKVQQKTRAPIAAWSGWNDTLSQEIWNNVNHRSSPASSGSEFSRSEEVSAEAEVLQLTETPSGTVASGGGSGQPFPFSAAVPSQSYHEEAPPAYTRYAQLQQSQSNGIHECSFPTSDTLPLVPSTSLSHQNLPPGALPPQHLTPRSVDPHRHPAILVQIVPPEPVNTPQTLQNDSDSTNSMPNVNSGAVLGSLRAPDSQQAPEQAGGRQQTPLNDKTIMLAPVRLSWAMDQGSAPVSPLTTTSLTRDWEGPSDGKKKKNTGWLSKFIGGPSGSRKVNEEHQTSSRQPDHRQEGNLSTTIAFLIASASYDWDLVLNVCECASSNEVRAKEAIRVLRKEFKHGEPPGQLGAARLWAIMLQNSSKVFVNQLITRKFLDTVDDLLSNSRTSLLVKERVLDVVAAAAYANLNDNEKGIGFRDLWMRFKPPGKPDEGVPFDADDAMFNHPTLAQIEESPNRNDGTASAHPPGDRYQQRDCDRIPHHQEAAGDSVRRGSNGDSHTERGDDHPHNLRRISNVHHTSVQPISPIEEDPYGLFRECAKGKAIAGFLKQALLHAVPERFDSIDGDGIRGLRAQCIASQELIASQIPFVAVGADPSSREGRPEGGEGTTGKLLSELLGANEELNGALKQYKEFERYVVEWKAWAKRLKKI